MSFQVAQGAPRANVRERSCRPRCGGAFARASKGEALKGRRAAPLKIALIAPLPFCALGMSAGGMGGGGAVGAFSTYGWNWWCALMLPIAVALMTASVANIDARQGLRPVLGLPLPPAATWWAKAAYALSLVFAANLVVFAANVVVVAAGGGAPTVLAGLATAAMVTVASSWMVPAVLFLTMRFGTLAGIVAPVLVQIVVGIVMGWSDVWFLFPMASALCAPAPFTGVAPSGVPLASGDALGMLGWQTAAGLGVSAALFALLVVLGARWFSGREVR